MSGRAPSLVIPARFLLTTGHFVTMVLAWYGRAAAVGAGLPASAGAADVAAATASLTAALSIAVVAFAVQYAGLLGGATLFRTQLNVFHAVAHFFGGVLTAWFVIDAWGYLSYW
jgi:hypothetical protein